MLAISVLKPHRRIAKNFKNSVSGKYLNGVTNKRISKRLKVSQSTEERIIQKRFEVFIKKKLNCDRPTIMCTHNPQGLQVCDDDSRLIAPQGIRCY